MGWLIKTSARDYAVFGRCKDVFQQCGACRWDGLEKQVSFDLEWGTVLDNLPRWLAALRRLSQVLIPRQPHVCHLSPEREIEERILPVILGVAVGVLVLELSQKLSSSSLHPSWLFETSWLLGAVIDEGNSTLGRDCRLVRPWFLLLSHTPARCIFKSFSYLLIWFQFSPSPALSYLSCVEGVL
jgi:hypothetical protein